MLEAARKSNDDKLIESVRNLFKLGKELSLHLFQDKRTSSEIDTVFEELSDPENVKRFAEQCSKDEETFKADLRRGQYTFFGDWYLRNKNLPRVES